MKIVPHDDQRDPRTYAIIGAAMEVHRQLGSGFLEAIYQDALEVEFRLRGIPFRREVELPVQYKGVKLASTYRADFVCYDSVIVELKAVARLTNIEEAQIINYMNASTTETGLLLNFARPSLEYRRFALTMASGGTESAKSAESAVREEKKED